MRRIRSAVEIGLSEEIEYYDLPDNWDEMTEAQQDEYLVETAAIHQNNVAPCGATVVEVDEDGNEVKS